jgi:alpha-L-fucosidase
MHFEPTPESLVQHSVPSWYLDAKLGIFVHWGLFSVPAWAPVDYELGEVAATGAWESWFIHNAYAEWYLNSLRIEGSPTQRHHLATYGEDFSYDDFVTLFNEAIQDWNPDEWAKLFGKVGARYVVLVTKHHDGFLLWPSEHSPPSKQGYKASRDIVGELSEAVRRQGMRMGLYYSGGLDWTFTEVPIRDLTAVFRTIVQTPEFIKYVDRHWRELIERYQPSVLWGDIGYPAAANVSELFADYYNAVPDGVINDRFSQKVPDSLFQDGKVVLPSGAHSDFTTPEYASYATVVEKKWEATRGIGRSFGYNQNEGPDDYASVGELVHMLVDIVSKNGNLLLNVGPMADGTIPQIQRERLEGLGAWLDVNGEAIFGSRPCPHPEGLTSEGTAVRFTQKAGALFATLLGAPAGDRVTLEGLRADRDTTIRLLGHDEVLSWRREGDKLAVTLPGGLPGAPAYSLKVTPIPDLAQEPALSAYPPRD